MADAPTLRLLSVTIYARTPAEADRTIEEAKRKAQDLGCTVKIVLPGGKVAHAFEPETSP